MSKWESLEDWEAWLHSPERRNVISELAPLLAQPFIELDRQQIMSSFLKNLQSRELIEAVLAQNDLLTDKNGKPLTPQETFTTIRNLSSAIEIAAAEYDFLPELKDQISEIDQISYSILTPKPTMGSTLLNGLLKLASQKTTQDFISDINGAKAIQLSKLQNQLKQVEMSAVASQLAEIEQLQSALQTAKALGISEPTYWEGLNNERYLKGSKALTAELEALKNSKPALPALTIGYNTEGFPMTISADSIEGQINTIESYQTAITEVAFIPQGLSAQIPADAEKPNRKLIAIAATVLAGFFGLFLALIRIAIKDTK